MDFSGKGFISEDNFMQSIVIKRISYSEEDIICFLRQFNLFPLHGGNRSKQTDSDMRQQRGVMIFDTFKKVFFPYLHQTFNIVEIMQQNDDQDEDKITNRILKQPQYVKDRLVTLDNFLKSKFQSSWVSVRKAFLDLDLDHDGFISVEDIMKYFGAENELNFNDLTKLMTEKDSNKKGFLNYQDFSKWVANSIHLIQGFYFRHDSIKNPVFDNNFERQALRLGKFKDKISKDLIKDEDMTKKLLEKIGSQWKTIRKSFHDFSKEKSGGIEVSELKFYLNHWGMQVTDEQLNRLYSELDWDKDGFISYTDFQKTVGYEILPREKLYFRQDQPKMLKINTCKYPKCWQPTKQGGFFCNLHQKVNQNMVNEIFMKIYDKIGKKWRKFMNEISREAEGNEKNDIKFESFKNICQKYGFSISEVDKELLLDTTPGQDEGQRLLLRISKLYEMRQQHAAQQTYKQIEMDSDNEEKPHDLSGFTGNFHRVKEKLEPISETEIYKIIASDEKNFAEFMRIIKYIDKDHNGYITSTEMDDIIKQQYPILRTKDLYQIIKKYRSIQNTILVDYKKFRNDVCSRMKLFESKDQSWQTMSFGQKDQVFNKFKEGVGYQDTELLTKQSIVPPKEYKTSEQQDSSFRNQLKSAQKQKSTSIHDEYSLSPVIDGNLKRQLRNSTICQDSEEKSRRPNLNYSTLNMTQNNLDHFKHSYSSFQVTRKNIQDGPKQTISIPQINQITQKLQNNNLKQIMKTYSIKKTFDNQPSDIENAYTTTLELQKSSDFAKQHRLSTQTNFRKRNIERNLLSQSMNKKQIMLIQNEKVDPPMRAETSLGALKLQNPEQTQVISKQSTKKEGMESNLTEKIKEFRSTMRQLKKIQSKDIQSKRIEKSVENFRSTLKGFGLGLSNNVDSYLLVFVGT